MPTIARFTLDGSVLPLVHDTLPLAEAIRRALMSKHQELKRIEKYGRPIQPDAERFVSRVFSGKDEQRLPLQDDHSHAFYLPTDEDRDGRLDHVTVYASRGFPADEIRTINSLHRLTSVDLDLSLLLVGLGQEAGFRDSRIFGESTTWIAATPFLVTRHIKRRGRKRDPREFFETPEGLTEFVKQVLREELQRRGLFQDGTEIEQIAHTGDHPHLRPLQFQLARRKPGDDAAGRPRGLFRIRFPQPVTGPIALGHSCHFGLGLFLCEINS